MAKESGFPLSEMREKKLSVIVPVFNEARAILSNLKLLVSEVEPYFSNYEIIVIVDGSTDGTSDVVEREENPKIRCVSYEVNQGKGFAVRKGFDEARGDYVLFIDGGMELHPKEIRIFIGLQALYGADIVLGSKRHPQSRVEYPWVRRMLSALYQGLVKYFFDLDVTDTQVGIKLFRAEVIEAIRSDLNIDRYGFDLEILALAKLRGFNQMLEAPIQLDYFSRATRKGFLEVLHILNVGFHIAKDTIRVYRKLATLRKAASRRYA